MNTKLLTIADIAALHQCDVRRAREKVVNMAGFPDPVPTSTPRRRLWLESAVLKYLRAKTAQKTAQ